MATPSQNSETPATSTVSSQTAATPDSPNSKADKNDVEIVVALVNKAYLVSDLSLLQSGSFSDFTVICGKQEWKVHRFALSRCPYFKPIVSEQSVFKEAIESSITINGFEPFEIEWLLRYIYSLQLDCVQAQASSPHNSYFETCVLLWSIGDFFCLPAICEHVMSQLALRCLQLYVESRPICSTINGICFWSDLEAGIRAAWRSDRVAGETRKQLLTLCCGLHSALRDEESFVRLLEEIPEFAIDFLKALLGRPGMLAGNPEHQRLVCCRCQASVLDPEQGDGKTFIKGAFVWTPFSVSVYSRDRSFYCSKECYNKGRINAYKYPDKPEEARD